MYTLAGAAVGLLSAVFFCIGNATNSVEKIALQSTPFWDFSEPIARMLAGQRAQYITGGVLLSIAFGLQVVAAALASAAPAPLPRSLQPWPNFLLAVLLATGLLSWLLCARLERTTIQQVLERHAKALAEAGVENSVESPQGQA